MLSRSDALLRRRQADDQCVVLRTLLHSIRQSDMCRRHWWQAGQGHNVSDRKGPTCGSVLYQAVRRLLLLSLTLPDIAGAGMGASPTTFSGETEHPGCGWVGVSPRGASWASRACRTTDDLRQRARGRRTAQRLPRGALREAEAACEVRLGSAWTGEDLTGPSYRAGA